MAVIERPHFLNLSPDNRAQIFDQVLEKGGSLGSRATCRQQLILVDTLIKKKWEDLQKNPPPGPFGFREACNRIHKKYSIHGIYPENFNYLTLFRALNREWGVIGVNIHDRELNVAPFYQAELQAFLYQRLNDFSLVQMWDRTLAKVYQFGWSGSDAISIRNFLSLPRTQDVLSTMERMDFSNLEIRYIPIEMSYFSGLTALRLCRNNIDVLPDFIGNLRNLRILNLEDNDLQVLPKDFPNWTHLKVVNLKDNPLNHCGLQQLAEWRANVAAMQAEVPMELG